MCQYPISDNSHFYIMYLMNCLLVFICVNILFRITLISTSSMKNHLFMQIHCVNILFRITLISTKSMNVGSIPTGMCQYPISDNSHFYILSKNYSVNTTYQCQYPISDNSHFYRKTKEENIMSRKCVNILFRITLISTKIINFFKELPV